MIYFNKSDFHKEIYLNLKTIPFFFHHCYSLVGYCLMDYSMKTIYPLSFQDGTAFRYPLDNKTIKLYLIGK